MIYRLGGDIHLLCIASTLDGIEDEISEREREGTAR